MLLFAAAIFVYVKITERQQDREFDQMREYHRLLDVERQKHEDRLWTDKIEAEVKYRYQEQIRDKEYLDSLDKTKPYWEMLLPIKISRVVCGVYHVYDDNTAKYKGVRFEALIEERITELKNGN